MHDLSGWGNSTPSKVKIQKCYFFYYKLMLQNSGCNRKKTLLDLKDDDNIFYEIHTRIEFIFACKMYPNFSIVCSPNLRKPTTRSQFSRFFKNLLLLLC